MFLFLVSSFTTWSFPRCVPVSSVVVQEHLVHAFESFSQVVLEGCEGSADGWSPKAMGDEAEVSQAALNAWFQNRGGPAVTNGRPVLGQEICKFFTKLPARRREEGERKPSLVTITSQSSCTSYRVLCLSYKGIDWLRPCP